MVNEIRYEAALAAARQVLGEFGLSCSPATAKRLGKVAYLVLEAIYETEHRLAEQPTTHLLCVWCLRSLQVRPGIDGQQESCPRCGCKMQLPETAVSN
jgi:hypothetical protein